MGGGEQLEARVGWAVGDAEVALAGLYRDPADVDNDAVFGFRAYGLATVVDANMITPLFGANATLPPGELYVGVFAGIELRDYETEAGLLLGGKLGVIRIEYQYALRQGVIPDEHTVMVGVRKQFGEPVASR